MNSPSSKAGCSLRRVGVGLGALVVSTCIWLPALHLFYTRPANEFYRPDAVSPTARRLAARHLRLWTDPNLRARELGRMRASNAEWDFMGRSFLAWSLANLALHEPAAAKGYLEVIDRIIDETLRLEAQNGMHFFLMPYSKARPYVVQPARSLFLDGEIALMLAMRRVVEEKDAYRAPLTDRVGRICERMNLNPAMAAESYPDECWMFDHTVALDAVKLADYLDGSNHAEFIGRWLKVAKTQLVHPPTGLLISSYSLNGDFEDGPEGSTLWMVAHCLQILDGPFGRDQYERARRELGRTVLGFSYAREWPASWQGQTDIDSGPIIPVLGVSAGASGMAFIGACAFGDWPYLRSLAATLDMAAFPASSGKTLKYCASNQVGDAALLYAAVQGPLWQKVKTPRQMSSHGR